MPSMGTVKLSDPAPIFRPRQQAVMRDRYFQPVQHLWEYLRMAEDNGSPQIECPPTSAHCIYFGLVCDPFGLYRQYCTIVAHA